MNGQSKLIQKLPTILVLKCYMDETNMLPTFQLSDTKTQISSDKLNIFQSSRDFFLSIQRHFLTRIKIKILNDTENNVK